MIKRRYRSSVLWVDFGAVTLQFAVLSFVTDMISSIRMCQCFADLPDHQQLAKFRSHLRRNQVVDSSWPLARTVPSILSGVACPILRCCLTILMLHIAGDRRDGTRPVGPRVSSCRTTPMACDHDRTFVTPPPSDTFTSLRRV